MAVAAGHDQIDSIVFDEMEKGVRHRHINRANALIKRPHAMTSQILSYAGDGVRRLERRHAFAELHHPDALGCRKGSASRSARRASRVFFQPSPKCQ